LTPVGPNLFFYCCVISIYACKCCRFLWYPFFSSINFFFFAYVVFFLSSSNSNRDALFKFTNSKFVKTFSFFSLVSAFTWLPKASCCCLWSNNSSMHFLFVVSQILAFCPKSYSSSSCDFNFAMLPLSSSFSSYNFLMNTFIFYLIFSLFFLHISTLCLYPFWKSLSLSNSSYSIAFSFSPVANLLFKLFTSIFKFPIFRLLITMVWNNSIALSAFITFVTTSSTDFGVFVYVIRFLDFSANDPISCSNPFPNPNSNGIPFADPGLLISTCSFDCLNTTKEGYVSTLSVCNLVAYRPCVYYCCCCKCCCKC